MQTVNVKEFHFQLLDKQGQKTFVYVPEIQSWKGGRVVNGSRL